MSNSVFPTFKTLGWPFTRRALWHTLSNEAESGRAVHVRLWSAPLYEWDLQYNGLSLADQATLWGFYNARSGAFDDFLLSDQTDNFAPGAQLGVGDGVTKAFQFCRAQGGYVEAQYDVQQTPTPPVIYLNGAVQAGTAYSISYLASGILTFVTAPGSGVVITADFYFYYRAMFTEDKLELAAILQGAATGKLTLRMVRT